MEKGTEVLKGESNKAFTTCSFLEKLEVDRETQASAAFDESSWDGHLHTDDPSVEMAVSCSKSLHIV